MSLVPNNISENDWVFDPLDDQGLKIVVSSQKQDNSRPLKVPMFNEEEYSKPIIESNIPKLPYSVEAKDAASFLKVAAASVATLAAFTLY